MREADEPVRERRAEWRAQVPRTLGAKARSRLSGVRVARVPSASAPAACTTARGPGAGPLLMILARGSSHQRYITGQCRIVDPLVSLSEIRMVDEGGRVSRMKGDKRLPDGLQLWQPIPCLPHLDRRRPGRLSSSSQTAATDVTSRTSQRTRTPAVAVRSAMLWATGAGGPRRPTSTMSVALGALSGGGGNAGSKV